ncbi:MAG: hypothetical protein GY870_18540 [archaeon]|nr:hypothetical protein [archaeon]
MKMDEKEIIIPYLKRYMKINSEIGYPDLLEAGYGQKFEGYEIFENLIPGIVENIAHIIYEETFGQVSSDISSLMQSVKIKTIMSKKYENLREIIGEKRFERYIDFPTKIKNWRKKNFPPEIVHKNFVESVINLFLTSAKRNQAVFEVELLPIIRKQFKIYIYEQYPQYKNINVLTLDELVREIIKMMDLGRATDETKNLIKDLQIYCLIIYFINQFNKLNIVVKEEDIIPILNMFRNEITQISEKLRSIEDVKNKIDIAIKKLMKNN